LLGFVLGFLIGAAAFPADARIPRAGTGSGLSPPVVPAVEPLTTSFAGDSLSEHTRIDGPPAALTTIGPLSQTARRRVQEDCGRIPMHFEPNRGQTAKEVKFLARGAGYALFLTSDELVMSLRRSTPSGEDGLEPGIHWLDGPLVDSDVVGPLGPARAAAEQETFSSAVLRFGFVGANSAPAIEGIDPLGGYSNYFIGNDPAKWRTGIPQYGRVRVKDLYPGIDLVLRGNPQQLEYDFVVAPGADPDQIRLSIHGAEDLRIDEEENLVLAVAGGELVQKAPRVYQEINSKWQPVIGGTGFWLAIPRR
jgi:hypothetical protein